MKIGTPASGPRSSGAIWSSAAAPGQIGDQELATSSASTLSLRDHPRADVNGYQIGTLVEQPLRLRSGSAPGIEHYRPRKLASTSDLRAGRSRSPLNGPWSVLDDQTAASRSYASRVRSVCSAWLCGVSIVTGRA